MSIVDITRNLRLQLTEYRYLRKNAVTSIHINAIEMALCLVEYHIKEKRPIGQEEQWCFEAAYHVSYILDGGDWEILSTLYCGLVAEVKKSNYFQS